MIEPEKPLPFCESYGSVDEYVRDLLSFVTTSRNLDTLCGGVHILDFLTRESDLYESVLPSDWRAWLNELDIANILDFLMREDLSKLAPLEVVKGHGSNEGVAANASNSIQASWRGNPLPPNSLLSFVKTVRNLSLNRTFELRRELGPKLPKSVTAGMNQKKFHEVERFASFVDDLASYVSDESSHRITHLVDFGSGQNYLGRVLASPPCRRRVVAVEGRPINVDGAKRKDVFAKLAKKQVIWRNKKVWRVTGNDNGEAIRLFRAAEGLTLDPSSTPPRPTEKDEACLEGHVQYIQQSLSNGDLTDIVDHLEPCSTDGSCKSNEIAPEQTAQPPDSPSKTEQSAYTEPNLLVISLHSCGNLIHHGLRSLVLNPSVKAVALVGCCYNLCTERLGLPTFKLPSLRAQNKRLEQTSSACDPHGFPMSARFMEYEHDKGTGVRWNITARMMAVQAPLNWTRAEYESFFTRHFYRALLQRLFLDRGFVGRPEDSSEPTCGTAAGSGGEPIIIGSLQKSCYVSFVTYVRGAWAKLADDPLLGPKVGTCFEGLTDAEIVAYEERYEDRRHHLCILWSLMAFSASVVESCFVTDRLLYLKEQPQVKSAWVQTVFEYGKSPRNLAVVGIKR